MAGRLKHSKIDDVRVYPPSPKLWTGKQPRALPAGRQVLANEIKRLYNLGR